MRRQSAHRVESDGVAGNGVVLLTPGVGPTDRQFDTLITCRDAHFVGKAADGIGRNAGHSLSPLRRVVLDTFVQQLERRLDRRAVLHLEFAKQEGIGALGMRHHRLVRLAIPPQLVLRVVTGLLLRHLGAQEHAEFVAGLVAVHQFAGV